MLFAALPEALSRCLAVIVRSIETHLLQRAGLRRSSGPHTGVVALIQRHGSGRATGERWRLPRFLIVAGAGTGMGARR
jgi:hypothetical protein